MNPDCLKIDDFNRHMTTDNILLEGFSLGLYHIMPRVVHLSNSKGGNMAEPHNHRIWEFNLILKGDIFFSWRNSQTQLHLGDVFFMPPGQAHGWQMLSDDFLILGLQTSISFFSSNSRRQKKELMTRMEEMAHHISGNNFLMNTAWNLISLVHNAQLPFFREKGHLLIRHIYIEIFSKLFPAGVRLDFDDAERTYGNLTGKDVTETLEYYVSDNMNRMISVAEVCKHFRMSECQLNRICRRETGKTISGYIANCKIGMAKNLLTNTNKLIKEIALLTGYTDINYFSRIFKRKTEMTPEEYRNKNRE